MRGIAIVSGGISVYIFNGIVIAIKSVIYSYAIAIVDVLIVTDMGKILHTVQKLPIKWIVIIIVSIVMIIYSIILILIKRGEQIGTGASFVIFV